MAAVWLVRHAPTSLVGVCYGQSDVPVQLAAEDAACSIARQWEQAGQVAPPALWTSPWLRTQSVAAELARLWRVSWHVDARLSELCFGAWEGREYDEIAHSDVGRWQHWTQNYEQVAPPEGETVAQLRARVAEWLDERRAGTVDVLAITHAGVMRTARAVIERLPYTAVAATAVPYLRIERFV